MDLPQSRGPLTAGLFARLRGDDLPAVPDDPSDDDVQLALWVLYELHYRGFDDVDDRLEWAPDLIGLRRQLEERFESEVRELVGPAPPDIGSIEEALLGLATTEEQQRPALAGFLGAEATREQFAEFLQLRSVYHLKESDPHTFVLPRLEPAPKAALAELLYDEFGSGRPERVHQRLFAEALAAMDLTADYGAYVDRAPASVLAESNLMSLVSLNRRLRGAAMGHLAAFEATSSVPSRFIATGARRLELPDEVARYFDEHVEADAVHEQVAIRDICGRLVADEPGLLEDVLLGARACLALAGRCGGHMLEAWREGKSALLPDSREEVAA